MLLLRSLKEYVRLLNVKEAWVKAAKLKLTL